MISTRFIVAFLNLFLACNAIGAEIDGAEDVPGVRGRQLKQKSSKAPKLPDEAPKGTKAPKVPKAL